MAKDTAKKEEGKVKKSKGKAAGAPTGAIVTEVSLCSADFAPGGSDNH